MYHNKLSTMGNGTQVGDPTNQQLVWPTQQLVWPASARLAESIQRSSSINSVQQSPQTSQVQQQSQQPGAVAAMSFESGHPHSGKSDTGSSRQCPQLMESQPVLMVFQMH